jgi:hypothetical protein
VGGDEMFMWCGPPDEEWDTEDGGYRMNDDLSIGLSSVRLHWGSCWGYDDILCKENGLDPRTCSVGLYWASLCGDEDVLCSLESETWAKWGDWDDHFWLSSPWSASNTGCLGQYEDSGSCCGQSADEEPTKYKLEHNNKKLETDKSNRTNTIVFHVINCKSEIYILPHIICQHNDNNARWSTSQWRIKHGLMFHVTT